jgi:RNA polymerase sigma-70 factor (ECF subfamily)
MITATSSYRANPAAASAKGILLCRVPRPARHFPNNRKLAARAESKPAETKSKPAETKSKPDSALLNETLRLAQQGDAGAFEEIYRLHSRRVFSLCLRMLGDPIEAEDLAQEAFLQLFRKIHTFRGESAFSSWLHRLTANVVLMSFRRKKAVVASLDEVMRINEEDSAPRWEIGGPDLRLAGVFDRANLQTAVEQLPEGYKRMFLLHDVHGYEHNEIAEILGCSIGNSKSQLHKARKRLRELLRGLKHQRPQENRQLSARCPAFAV